MIRRPASLRVRLAITGTVFVAIPIAVMLTAVVATTETEETGPNGAVEVTSSTVSPWLLATAAGLVAIGGAGAWWWSGRSVRSVVQIAALADDIEHSSLDRRANLNGAAREVQALGDSFDRMLDRLADTSARQRHLIEDTSHQLRTPLAALAATTEGLLAAPDLAEHRAALERIDRQIKRMGTTIDGLLSDARAGSALVSQTDNDVAAVVARVVEAQRGATPDARIIVRSPESLHLGVDGTAVERAVAALLENAVRHASPGGAAEVEIAVRGDSVDIAITDDGAGLDPTVAERIFDRYERSVNERRGDSSDAGVEGTGIGLAIVKAVADAYGGVSVESPLGPHGGARFTLHLPATNA